MTTTVKVPVPKNLQGKVIGKGGATLQDIESDYPGVNVTVPKRDDPSEFVTISGPPDAVRHAQRRVMDICGLLQDESAEARKKAQSLFDEADKLFDKMKKTKDKNEKNRLRNQAENIRNQAFDEQKKAAKKIFRAKNSGYGNDQMDLHGLQVKEALGFVEERLRVVDKDLRSGALPTLTIITGAGHHSKNNKALIKPQVMELLKKKGYPFTLDASGGEVLVSFANRPPTTTTPQRPPKKEQKKDQPRKRGFLGFLISCICGASAAAASTVTEPPARQQGGQATTGATGAQAQRAPASQQEAQQQNVATV